MTGVMSPLLVMLPPPSALQPPFESNMCSVGWLARKGSCRATASLRLPLLCDGQVGKGDMASAPRLGEGKLRREHHPMYSPVHYEPAYPYDYFLKIQDASGDLIRGLKHLG